MKYTKYCILFIYIISISYSIPDVSTTSGICIAIEEFIENTSKSPDLIEYLESSSIMEFENGLYAQRVKFRDRSDPNYPKVFNFIFLMEGDHHFAKVVTAGNPGDFANSLINNSFRVRKLYDRDGTPLIDSPFTIIGE